MLPGDRRPAPQGPECPVVAGGAISRQQGREQDRVVGDDDVGRALSTSRFLAEPERLGHAGEMTSDSATYPGHRFPAEIISRHVRFQESWTL